MKRLAKGLIGWALIAVIVLGFTIAAQATISFSNQRQLPPAKTAPFRAGYVDITFDNAYPDGGWSVSAADLNLTTLRFLGVPAFGTGTNGYAVGLRWDITSSKILAHIIKVTGTVTKAMSGIYMTNATVANVEHIYELDDGDATLLSGETVRAFYLGN
jgi:hypothetical protein